MALTTTRSPVRPFARPCTVMAKLCCDGSRSDAWDRHQTRHQHPARVCGRSHWHKHR